jgi:hypothetical protein
MFCLHHPVPHEDCADCRPTVTRMRPTVFAELAAAELHRGTGCCAACEYLYFGQPARCPRCRQPLHLVDEPGDGLLARADVLHLSADRATWSAGQGRHAEPATAALVLGRPPALTSRARTAEA